ncbi:MAG: zinc ribbon domain-containing protein [Candidatus Thorarchaeota archaeon]
MTQSTCPLCKRPIEKGLKFCPYCGTEISLHDQRENIESSKDGRSSVKPSPTPKLTPCLLCGKEIPVADDFCSFCGAEKYKSKRERLNGQRTFQCPKCNKLNPEGTKFCLQCGQSIEIVGAEKLLEGRKFTGFEIPLTALAVPLISASDATILSQIVEQRGQGSSFPHRVENTGSYLFRVQAQSFKSYRTAISRVLFPYNIPHFVITCILVSVIYALWLTVLTSIKDGNPMVLVELFTLVMETFFPGMAEDTGSVLSVDKVLDNYILSLPYSILISAIIIAPSLILAVIVFRRNESLIEYRVSAISVGFSFGFSLLVPSVIQPGYPIAKEQVSARDLGYGYAVGLLVTEGATFLLFLVVLGKIGKFYDLGLPEDVLSRIALAFVFAAWACLFLTFPLANPLWKTVIQFNKGIYYFCLAMTITFVLFHWLFFSDIHHLIYEAANS